MSRPIDELFDELSGPAMPLGPSDWPEPGALRRRGERRRTVRRASIATAVAVVVVGVAVALPATLSGSHRKAVTPADTVSPTLVHHAAPAPDGNPLGHGATVPIGPVQGFGTFSLVVPTGWSSAVITDGRAWGQPKQALKGVCFVPPGQPAARSIYGCKGLAMYYGDFLPGDGTAAYDNQSVSRKNVPAWRHGTVPASCPVPAGATTGAATVGSLKGPAVFSYPVTGNATAAYNVWRVSCADGTSFSPRAWYYPTSHAVFFLFDDNPKAQALLETFQKHR